VIDSGAHVTQWLLGARLLGRSFIVHASYHCCAFVGIQCTSTARLAVWPQHDRHCIPPNTKKTTCTAAPSRPRSCAPHWRPRRPCAAAWRCAGPARSAASGRGRPRDAPLAGPGAAPLRRRAHSAPALPVPARACTSCQNAYSQHWLSGECQDCEGALGAQRRSQVTAEMHQCCCVNTHG